MSYNYELDCVYYCLQCFIADNRGHFSTLNTAESIVISH